MGHSQHLEGSCHCGNIHYQLHLTKKLETYIGRACQCSFCRKHNATYISDTEGKLSITIKHPELVNHYTFSSKVAEFLICKSCGVLPCVVRTIENRRYGVVNIHSLESNQRHMIETQPLDYDGESESNKKQRHSRNWIADVNFT